MIRQVSCSEVGRDELVSSSSPARLEPTVTLPGPVDQLADVLDDRRDRAVVDDQRWLQAVALA